MSPKVSVIVPVYNVAEYLGQCLDTILLQTLQDIEVICVDDGSTDDSPNILNTYAMFDDRLKVIHQENAGLGPARNRGLKDATGEFVIFLDSDDFFHPEMLEKMVAKAEEDGSDIVRCSMLLFDNIKEKDYREKNTSNKEWLIHPFIIPLLYKTDLFYGATVWQNMIKHSLLTETKLLFQNIFQEDIPFTFTLMTLAKKISLLPDAFIHYRQNRLGSLMEANKDNLQIFFEPWLELWKNLKRYNKHSIFEKSFKNAFLRALSWKIPDLNDLDKKEILTSFRKNVPLEIQELFGFGNGKAKISLIICAYNAAPFLQECLDSCLNQTLKEIEIICVDDGSTDNTLEILNQYAQKDSRIKIIHQENQGLPISRNNAMKIATGEYVWYVDADDFLDSDSCECLYLYAKIYNLDMLSFASIDFKNNTKQEFEEPYHCLKWLPEKFIPVFTWKQISNVLPQVAVTSPLTIYRHQYLLNQDITWINKKVAYEDTPFFTESLLKGARMGALPIKFYHKRIHEAAITQNMNTNFADYCWIVEYTLQRINKILKKEKNIFVLYYYGLVQKVFLNYAENFQPNMNEPLYNLCYNLVKKYRFPLAPMIKERCIKILEENKKSKLKFLFWHMLTSRYREFYAINLISFQKKPLSLKILGIPVCYTQQIEKNIEGSKEIKRELVLKTVGLKVWKIRDIKDDFSIKPFVPLS